MKAYSLLVIFIFVHCVCEYTLVEIMPKLKRNILNFVVVMKFVLPTMKDLKFSPI